MKSIRDAVYGADAQANRLDVCLPDGICRAAFVYFHGGGLEAGDKSDAGYFAQQLAARGIAVVSANYRMYPTAKYPDFIEDAADAVAWTVAHAEAWGCKKHIFVGGSSAGGYLSMMLCFDSHYLKKRGLSADAIAGYVHDAGQPTCHFNVLRERGIDPRRVIVDDSCALYHVGVSSVYPPMRFIVSDGDMENRLEQTQLMLSTLRHFGHKDAELILMHGSHCQYVAENGAEGENALGRRVSEFIEAQLASER